MPKPPRYPQMLTANRLGDGEVVYLTAAGTWSEHLADGHAESDVAAIAALEEKGRADEDARIVVGAYLFDVDLTGDRPAPVSTREIIRARGPTVRGDLGKQARAPSAA